MITQQCLVLISCISRRNIWESLPYFRILSSLSHLWTSECHFFVLGSSCSRLPYLRYSDITFLLWDPVFHISEGMFGYRFLTWDPVSRISEGTFGYHFRTLGSGLHIWQTDIYVTPLCHSIMLHHRVTQPCSTSLLRCHATVSWYITLLNHRVILLCDITILHHHITLICYTNKRSNMWHHVTPWWYTMLFHHLVTPSCYTITFHHSVTPT